MVTGEYLRQKLIEPLKEKQRAEGFAEGFAEGRAEIDAAWGAWNRRRMAAEAEGKSFEEPPPSI
jgi:flagellar biosynthesis/type III secretory pathway protein FliH